MTAAERRRKRWLYAVIIGYFFLGYYSCQWVSSHRDTAWTFFLPGERAIPFLPHAIVGYLLVFLTMILLYIPLDHFAHFYRTWRQYCWLSTIHFCCFLLVPVRMERPELLAVDWATQLTLYMYRIDPPWNVFPSLHVSYPLLATCALWPFKRRWAWCFAMLTTIVAISVVLVKQHYIVDVLAAAVVTGVVYRQQRLKTYSRYLRLARGNL